MTTCLVWAQAGVPGAPRFETASIHTTSPNLRNGAMAFGMVAPTGGPGSGDPGRIRYPVANLKSILVDAFKVKDYQIEGPDWLTTQWFEIQATMPPDTTAPQFRLMLQNLLADRFGLTVHREVKRGLGYSLVVAKNGPKFRETSNTVPAQGDSGPINWEEHSIGADGFRALPSQLAGRAGLWFFRGLRGSRIIFQQQTMQTLAGTLSNVSARPVVDGTALPGKYDFTLTYTPDDFPTGDREPFPRIFDALQQQLGLKLEPNQLPVEVIVVDHIAKAPTGN
ncbi:MAG TPA: TIGR03435 family protein [Bryobacteraceae bacterium]